MERRDRLAELLTDDDVATLKHLAREGMGENSLRALASDLAYLEAWAQAATGAALPWPASESLALKFVAHHLWDPARRETDPQHGMPADVAAQLREMQLFCVATARMRHRPSSGGWRAGAPCIAGKGRRVRSARPVCAPRSGWRFAPAHARVSARASAQSPATCSTVCSPPAGPTGWPTPAILPSCCSAFASGGRRRSEVARLRVEQLSDEPPVPLDPQDPRSPTLPCVAIQLGRTKTGNADEAGRVLLVGPPVEALREWLERADISQGADLPRHRSLGGDGGEGADAAVDQPDRQAALRDGGLGGEGVFRPRLEIRVSDGGGATRRFLAGGYAAIPASIRATGGQLLQ